MKGMHARHGRWYFRYPVSLQERLYAIVFGPLAILLLATCVYTWFPHAPQPSSDISWGMLALATLYTLGRIVIAYVLALVVAVPLALLVVSNPTVEMLLLPVFDVLESVPILALFPVILFLFVQFGFLNAAAICILFLNMLWNIVFALVGGLTIIPKDILYAARVFGIRGFSRLYKIILPSVFPQLITGSLLAVSAGWNLIIVAEVLHTYIPGGTAAQDLFGIGNILVSAAAGNDTQLFLASVAALVIVIAIINFFVWQRLLHWSQRFHFE